MSLRERWRKRADNKEIAKIFEISNRAQKRWDDSFSTAVARVADIRGVYSTYSLELEEQDYRYITCFTAYLEAVKTETPLSRMEPDALALRFTIEAIKREKLEEITSQEVQMDDMDPKVFTAYAFHVSQISHIAAKFSKLSSVHDKPQEFFLATSVHANMLTQIRSGNIHQSAT